MFQSLPAHNSSRTAAATHVALGAVSLVLGFFTLAVTPPAQMLGAAVVVVANIVQVAMALWASAQVRPISQRHATAWMLIACGGVLRVLACVTDATIVPDNAALVSFSDVIRFASGIPVGFALSRLGQERLDSSVRLRALAESVIVGFAVSSLSLAFGAHWLGRISAEQPLIIAALVGRPGAGAVLIWSAVLALLRERDRGHRRAIFYCLVACVAILVTWFANVDSAIGLESVALVVVTGALYLAARASIEAVSRNANDIRSRYWQSAAPSRTRRLAPQFGLYLSMAAVAVASLYTAYGYAHAPHFAERGLTVCVAGVVLLSMWVHANEAVQGRRLGDRLRHVLTTTNRLVDSNTPRDAIPQAIDELRQLVPSRTVTVYLARKEAGYVRLKFANPGARPVESAVTTLAAPYADAMNSGNSVFGTREMHSAELIVPIRTAQETIGLIVMTADGGRGYTRDEASLVETLSSQLALSIDSFRLRRAAANTAITDERNRLARELHDSVSQALFSIALGSKTAREQIVRAQDATGTLDYVVSLSETALAEMRALVFELRPESMMQFGLLSALRGQLQSLCERHNMTASFDIRCAEPEEASTTLKEAAYRICMEAANNAVKHARAAELALSLDIVNGQLSMDLRDNGRGFDSGGSFPGHLGLISMRERAQRMGGTLEINSAIGRGTTVRVRLPLADSSSDVLG